ncbi:uncharacterized protein EV422DRAFT_527800 [Fimicolochytrium jonesii]|uniref:uncharacterized protein n=1 Tax=Fimicolochytrium jonesii TaxID=1396493 RepID=UPI0022FE8220|nr:uncharacterized protein EV422DRAFT_527800 [Fimicolochytrium jonesii]KAI8821343.1 hypothetical protein EV422DRAFT_527800 [Fimicolochytrium jonesii]
MGVTSLVFLPSAPLSLVNPLNNRLTDTFDFTETDETWSLTCRSYRDQVDARLRSASTTSFTNPATSSYTPKVQYVLTQAHVEGVFAMIATVGGRAAVPVMDITGGEQWKESGIVIEMDEGYEMILGKLKGLWVRRQEIAIEGIKYERGNYVIRVGSMKSYAGRGMFIQAEDTNPNTPRAEAFLALRMLLRQVLRGLPGVNDMELSMALHERAVSKGQNRMGIARYVPPHTSFRLALVLIYVVFGISGKQANDVDGREFDPDWHEYAAVRLPKETFGRAHEAYQFFRLFRQHGLL